MKQSHKKPIIVVVSGGFDPVHVGHVRMFEAAKKLGDKLIVVLNGDSWLKRKKGFVFMPAKERAEVIRGLAPVDDVYIHNSKTSHVSGALEKIRPDIFANGGDRKNEADIPEALVCRKHNIKMIFNVGGGKEQSSSALTNGVARRRMIERRPWGQFENLDGTNLWNLKTLCVNANSRLSLQKHEKRSEIWVVAHGNITTETRKTLRGRSIVKHLKPGEILIVPVGMLHRISSKKGGVLVEVAIGKFDENDITRYEDDYGRT